MPQQHRLALVDPPNRRGSRSPAATHAARNKHRNVHCTLGPMDAERLQEYASEIKVPPREILRIALNQYLNRVTGIKVELETIGKYALTNDVGTMQLIHEIAQDPGVSTGALETRVDHYQEWLKSRLETLERHGIVINRPSHQGQRTHWHLTRRGEKVAETIQDALT